MFVCLYLHIVKSAVLVACHFFLKVLKLLQTTIFINIQGVCSKYVTAVVSISVELRFDDDA